MRSTLCATLSGSIRKWWSGQNSHVVDLLRGASIAGVLKALSAVLAFGLSVVLGRVLGADAAGVYFLAFTTATIAATVGRAGLDRAALRFIASYASAEQWADVSAVYRTMLAIGLVCSFLVSAALYLAADFLANVMFSDLRLITPLRIMAVAVVPLSLGVLVSHALLGLSQIRDSILVSTIVPTGLALVGTLILGSMWEVSGATVAYLASVGVALVYGWRAWRRAVEGHNPTRLPKKDGSLTKPLVKSGAPLLIGALLQLVIGMSGTLMLGIWAENADVSRYAIAWRTATLISFILLAVNTIAQPKFAELYARGDIASLASTAHKATLLMTALATPVFLAFLTAPEFVMGVFGSDFADAGMTLQILSIGQFVNVAMGSVGVLLVMTGHDSDYRNVQVIGACVVLILNIMLIPRYGDIGAAFASASALIVQNILFGFFVWAKLGILMINPQPVTKRY
jgi:O-antigen/teichoic acid export membrane protein